MRDNKTLKSLRYAIDQSSGYAVMMSNKHVFLALNIQGSAVLINNRKSPGMKDNQVKYGLILRDDPHPKQNKNSSSLNRMTIRLCVES